MLIIFVMPSEVAQNSSEIQWDWPALWATLIKRVEIKTGNIRMITLRETGQKCNLAWTYDPVPPLSLLPGPLEIMTAPYLNPDRKVRLQVMAIYHKITWDLPIWGPSCFFFTPPESKRITDALTHQYFNTWDLGAPIWAQWAGITQHCFPSSHLPDTERQAGQGCGP